MPRWDPDAQQRLVAAATELFRQRGYETVTITEIAERAGLTRRSFFRHFPDKREVLFAGSARNTAEITEAMHALDASTPMRDAVLGTVAQMGEFLLRDTAAQARRQELIDSSPELRERERTKLASIATALADGLVARGTAPDEARLAGGVAAEIFHSAYLGAIRDQDRTRFTDRLDAAAAVAARLLAP
jgi:AcrR family transcriptional regulator